MANWSCGFICPLWSLQNFFMLLHKYYLLFQSVNVSKLFLYIVILNEAVKLHHVLLFLGLHLQKLKQCWGYLYLDQLGRYLLKFVWLPQLGDFLKTLWCVCGYALHVQDIDK